MDKSAYAHVKPQGWRPLGDKGSPFALAARRLECLEEEFSAAGGGGREPTKAQELSKALEPFRGLTWPLEVEAPVL
jgi:hypothetical protein